MSNPVAGRDPRGGGPRGLTTRLVLLGSYVALLHYTYAAEVAPRFGYLNLLYRTPEPLPYALVVASAAVLVAVMPNVVRRPSEVILWVLFVLVAIPSLIVPQFTATIEPDAAFRLSMVVGAIFLGIVLAARAGPRPRWNLPVRGEAGVWLCVAALSVTTYLYIALTIGIRIDIEVPTFGSLLDTRFAYRDETAPDDPLLGYLIRAQGFALNPAIAARAVYNRRWVPLVLAAVGQLVLFTITGYKILLLSVPAIIVFTLVFRLRSRLNGRAVLAGAVAVVAGALLVNHVTGNPLAVDVFVNRLMLTPGTITTAHVVVFSALPKAQWSHSFMAELVDAPHRMAPDFIVGMLYFKSPQTSANGSLFADGFSNAGYLGMAIEAAALVVLLRLVDATTEHLPLAVSASLLLVPTIALANAGVFLSLFTSGFAYVMPLAMAIPMLRDPEERTPT